MAVGESAIVTRTGSPAGPRESTAFHVKVGGVLVPSGPRPRWTRGEPGNRCGSIRLGLDRMLVMAPSRELTRSDRPSRLRLSARTHFGHVSRETPCRDRSSQVAIDAVIRPATSASRSPRTNDPAHAGPTSHVGIACHARRQRRALARPDRVSTIGRSGPGSSPPTAWQVPPPGEHPAGRSRAAAPARPADIQAAVLL